MKANIIIAVISFVLVIGGKCLIQEEETFLDQKTSKRDIAWKHYACRYSGIKIADEKDCRKYYDCKKKKDEVCPSGKLFDEKKSKCLPKHEVDCKKRKIFDDTDSSSESKEEQDSVCVKREGKFPHPTDCSHYYKCKSGKAELKSCSKNTLFHPKKNKCEPESKVHCGSKKNPYDPDSETNFTCPKDSGNFPHSDNCAKYYSCDYKLARLHNCHREELFDEKKHKCQPHEKVSCGDRKNPYEPEKKNNFVCPFPEGEFAHPQECNKYYLCKAFHPKLKTCAWGELFDTKKQRCFKEKKVNCGQRKKPIEKEFDCPSKKNGNYIAEHDCSLYYSCTAGRPHLESCPSQQLFDTSEGCMEAEKVDCGARFNPYEDESEISDEVDFDCPRLNGYYAYPDDCRSYYNCHNGTATLDSCPEGQMFDTFKLRCANERSVDCKRSINPMDVNDRHDRYRYRYRWCPRARGFFHHFSHCGYYYNCWHGRPSFRRCYHGRFWDVFRRRCYSKSLVDCGDREDKDKDDDKQGFTCPSSRGRYPDDTNCSTYYECDNRKWTFKSCSKGKLFDASKKKCEKHYKVDCGDRFDPEGVSDHQHFECPTSKGNYPNSEDCSRYYSCSRGKATLKVCPSGQLYDVERGDCERSYRVDCGERPNNKENDVDDNEVKCPTASGNYPHPLDCKRYYACFNGLAVEKKCRGGQLFDVGRGECESDYRVDCGARIDDSSSSSSSSEEGSFEKHYKCPTTRGNHPHPDCTLYYHCSNKKYQIKKCPDGQLYDVRRQDCDRWDKVDCGARKDPKNIKTTQKPIEKIKTTTIEPTKTKITTSYPVTSKVTKDNIGIEDMTTRESVSERETVTNSIFDETTRITDDYGEVTTDNNEIEDKTKSELFTKSSVDSSEFTNVVFTEITQENIDSTHIQVTNNDNEGGNTNEVSTVSYPDISRITKDNLVSTEDNSGNEGGNTNEASTVSYPDISRITKDNLVSTEDNSGNEGGNTNEASTVSYPDVSKSTATVIGIPTENRKIGTEEPITEIVTEFPSDSTVDTKILSTTGSNGMTSSFNGKFTKTDATTESVKTTAAVITDKPEGILECPEANGLFPHPDPHKWVHCSNWTPHIKDCPGKLVFDKKRKICNWSVSFSQDIPLPPGMKKDCNGQP